MRRTALMLGLTLALGIALGMIGTQLLNAQQTPVKASDLLKTDLAGMEGKEAIVQLVEFAPKGATGKHYHPGEEIGYVLEGSLTFEREGKPPQTVKAGEAFYGALPKQVHDAKNAGATGQLRVVVFRIHEKGQPVSVRVTEPYFQK